MEHWGKTTLKRLTEEEWELDRKPGDHGIMKTKNRPFKKQCPMKSCQIR